MSCTIHIADREQTVEAAAGATVLEALLDNGIHWMHACGALCNCTTCAIHVEDGMDNLTAMEEAERQTLTRFRGDDVLNEPVRLSCQATIHGDITIREPDWF